MRWVQQKGRFYEELELVKMLPLNRAIREVEGRERVQPGTESPLTGALRAGIGLFGELPYLGCWRDRGVSRDAGIRTPGAVE